MNNRSHTFIVVHAGIKVQCTMYYIMRIIKKFQHYNASKIDENQVTGILEQLSSECIRIKKKISLYYDKYCKKSF